MFSKFKQKVNDYFKKYGWKAVFVFFLYYLIRDVSLYIVIPWFIAKNIIR